MAQALTYRDYTFGIAELNQGAPATTGTRVVPSSAFIDTSIATCPSVQIPVDGWIYFDKNIATYKPNRANGFRQTNSLDTENNAETISPTFTWTAPVTLATADLIFSGLFQRCTEATTTPFVKAFQWPTVGLAWALAGTYGYPEFADDEGYFYAFIANAPIALYDQGILSCVPTQATFTCAPNANEQRLYCSSNWAGTLVHDTVTATVPTAYGAPEYFTFPNMTVKIAGTAMICYGISITVTPAFKFIPAAGDSATDIVMLRHEISGSIDILWDSTAQTIYRAYEADATPSELRINWGSGANPVTTKNDLEFTINAKWENFSPVGSEEQIIKMPWSAVYTTGTGYDAKFQIANALDRGWQS